MVEEVLAGGMINEVVRVDAAAEVRASFAWTRAHRDVLASRLR